MSSHKRRKWYWLGLTVSVLATLYCCSGVIMNAHFSMMGSEAQSAGHMVAAKIFAGLTLVGVMLSLGCIVALWRTRSSRSAV